MATGLCRGRVLEYLVLVKTTLSAELGGESHQLGQQGSRVAGQQGSRAAGQSTTDTAVPPLPLADIIGPPSPSPPHFSVPLVAF